MLNITPQTRRYLDAAANIPVNRGYESVWPSILESDPVGAPGVALALLANLRAFIELELREKGKDIPSDRKIMLKNDLLYLSDQIEEFAKALYPRISVGMEPLFSRGRMLQLCETT